MSCHRPVSHRQSLLKQVPMAVLLLRLESESEGPLAAWTEPVRPQEAGDCPVLPILVSKWKNKALLPYLKSNRLCKQTLMRWHPSNPLSGAERLLSLDTGNTK